MYVVCSGALVWLNKTLLTPQTPVLDLMWYQSLLAVIALHLYGIRPRITPALLGGAALIVANIGINLTALEAIDVAMSTALRRVSLILTFFGERFWFGRTYSLRAQVGIYFTLLGTLVAVSHDRASTWSAYGYVMFSNLLASASNLYAKKLLSATNQGLVLQYVMSGCMFLICSVSIWRRGLTLQPSIGVALSSSLSLCVGLSTLWSLEAYTPLTFVVVSSTRGIILTWCSCIGWLGADYIFSWPNFLGLQLASFGCVLYLVST